MPPQMSEAEVLAILETFPVGHPLRRKVGGPGDVEWALFSQKVENMEQALKKLIEEVSEANRLGAVRCENCATSKTAEDHERRIRVLEQMLWKAMGIAAAVAALMSFALDKIFNK